jgi:hypothetical protein
VSLYVKEGNCLANADFVFLSTASHRIVKSPLATLCTILKSL